LEETLSPTCLARERNQQRVTAFLFRDDVNDVNEFVFEVVFEEGERGRMMMDDSSFSSSSSLSDFFLCAFTTLSFLFHSFPFLFFLRKKKEKKRKKKGEDSR
tara:strand:- start:17965 stop:18270 length:306 start_codon:yes stop_codon:yes gene_type:complete